MHCHVKIAAELRLATCETNPRVRLYATAPATCTVVGDGEYRVAIPAGHHLPPTCYVGVDLYTSIRNAANVACDVHSAYQTADFYRLARLPPGARAPMRLVNRRAGDCHKGIVTMTVVSSATSKAAPAQSAALDDVAERMQGCLLRSVMTLQHLRPRIPVLRKVLAPRYVVRNIMDLPGVAYWMTNVPMQEQCAAHMLDVVLQRHGVDREAFAAFDARRAAPILGEFCTALPASLPYVADLYADEQRNTLRPFESFDDLFQRQAGDCEDASRAVCGIFNALRFGEWSDPAVRRLQAVSRNYAAFGVLGTIYLHGERQAHMHAELHPVAAFCARAGLPAPAGAATARLPVLIGEATVHMCCDFSGQERRDMPQARAVALPRGYDLEMVETWEKRRGFYDLNAHMYTDYFFRVAREAGNASAACPGFFSCLDDQGAYGAPFGHHDLPVHVHSMYTADDVRDMRRVVAFNTPTPPLCAPAVRIGARAADRGPAPTKTSAYSDVYCCTPDALMEHAFKRALRSAPQCSVEVTHEHFAAGFPAQRRVRLLWGRE